MVLLSRICLWLVIGVGLVCGFVPGLSRGIVPRGRQSLQAVDVQPGEFNHVVLGSSVPVVVDFYAPW